jgi:hypothetical protein
MEFVLACTTEKQMGQSSTFSKCFSTFRLQVDRASTIEPFLEFKIEATFNVHLRALWDGIQSQEMKTKTYIASETFGPSISTFGAINGWFSDSLTTKRMDNS